MSPREAEAPSPEDAEGTGGTDGGDTGGTGGGDAGETAAELQDSLYDTDETRACTPVEDMPLSTRVGQRAPNTFPSKVSGTRNNSATDSSLGGRYRGHSLLTTTPPLQSVRSKATHNLSAFKVGTRLSLPKKTRTSPRKNIWGVSQAGVSPVGRGKGRGGGGGGEDVNKSRRKPGSGTAGDSGTKVSSRQLFLMRIM